MAAAVVAASGAVAAAMLLYWHNPADSAFFPPCPVHRLTALHCPGCGSLRATHALLNGEFAAAFRLNPLLVISIPVLAGLVAKPSWSRKVWVPWTAFGVIVAFGILRNIPAWPLSFLAPHF